jgi:selenocysteine-specific elongation factor
MTSSPLWGSSEHTLGGASAPPLTLGTAGHIDHGKTALIAALTGVDTDRLPEERARGISIELGYAPLRLPSGRQLSVVDVPGHERFVRTMVAGATGIDLFLMVVAADDGVMPQTREHAAVLAGLGVSAGVVAMTKSDLAEPDIALEEAAELLPGVPAVAVSARTGAGLDELREALERVAGELAGRSAREAPARLHVDRVFTVKGAGTVVTGTLWAGAISRADELLVLPRAKRVRVRGVQVHDRPVESAAAGQRVAVNLSGVARAEVTRGDVLAAAAAGLEPTFRLDVALAAPGRPRHGQRVQVHHGTRESPARLAELGGRFWQLRLERPLLAAFGDRVVLRSIAPPDTLGGAVVLDARPPRHGPSRELTARLTRLERGEPERATHEVAAGAAAQGAGGATAPAGGDAAGLAFGRRPSPGSATAAPLSDAALALEARLREAWFEPPIESELEPGQAAELAALRAAGRAVRVGRPLHYHPDALAEIERRLVAAIERDGSITLAGLRDELQTSRKFAQALLEHFDGARLTRRLPSDERVLRRRP